MHAINTVKGDPRRERIREAVKTGCIVDLSIIESFDIGGLLYVEMENMLK